MRVVVVAGAWAIITTKNDLSLYDYNFSNHQNACLFLSNFAQFVAHGTKTADPCFLLSNSRHVVLSCDDALSLALRNDIGTHRKKHLSTKA